MKSPTRRSKKSPETQPILADAADLPEKLPQLLLPWFDRHQRKLPWRQTQDPYAIWLSETMLQQTQVVTALPYYHRFLKRFPTVQALAAAPLQEVLKSWSGLGYYRRARHLHEAAKAICENFRGIVPGTAAELVTLPGVGRYTAGAVASFAFNECTPIVDCNVARVLCRLLNWPVDPTAPQAAKALWQVAHQIVPADRPGAFNHALMELGATVCVPRAPQCLICPAQQCCQSCAAGTQQDIPLRKEKPATPIVKRAVFVLRHEGRVLLMQRPKNCIWEELWEFPALPDLSHFNSRTGLADVLREQLGLEVVPDRWRGRLSHQLTHRAMRYRIWRGVAVRGIERVLLPPCETGRYQAWRWLENLADVPVGTVTHKIATLARLD